METTDTQTFEMKTDAWLMWLVGLSILATVAAGVALMFAAPWWIGLLTLAITLGTVALVWALAWPVRYEVSAHAVIVHAGRQTLEVPFEDLVRLSPTRNILASPAAWSMDRMSLDYLKAKKGGAKSQTYILISPRDKAGLVAAIAARSPHHKAEGERLERA